MKTMTLEEMTKVLLDPKSGQGQEIRRHLKGSHGIQGDIYVHPIAKRPACWNVETTDQSRQIAIGQGVGSHHTAEGNLKVFWPDSIDNAVKNMPDIKGGWKFTQEQLRQCVGPIIEAKDVWRNPHPKHAHHEYPAGLFLVTYQLDYRTQRRVMD